MDPLDGRLRQQDGPFVEPLHLQVVCESLWRVRAAPDRITAGDFKRLAHDLGDDLTGVTAALARYYDSSIRETAERFRDAGVTERSIRNWFGRALISSSGLRLPVLLSTEKEFGLNAGVLGALAGRYLVRQDQRHGGIYYELAHDRLVDPVRKSNAAWRRLNPGPIDDRARLWDDGGRPDHLLLRDRELTDAEERAASSSEALSRLEREFLELSRAARSRAEEKRLREAARKREVVTVVVGLALCLILAVFLWWWNVRQRVKAERLSALLSMQRGLSYYEEGEVGPGLLCLAESLRGLPDQDAGLKRILRTQLAGWRKRKSPP